MARRVTIEWPLPDEMTEKILIDIVERERSVNPRRAEQLERDLSIEDRNTVYRRVDLKVLQCLRIRLGNFKLEGPRFPSNFGRGTAVEMWDLKDPRSDGDRIVGVSYTVKQRFDGNTNSFVIRITALETEQEQEFEKFKQALEQCLKDQTQFKSELGSKISLRTARRFVPILEKIAPTVPTDVLRKVAEFKGGPSKIGGRKSRRIRRRKRTTRRRS